jgi:hypothetical protein
MFGLERETPAWLVQCVEGDCLLGHLQRAVCVAASEPNHDLSTSLTVMGLVSDLDRCRNAGAMRPSPTIQARASSPVIWSDLSTEPIRERKRIRLCRIGRLLVLEVVDSVVGAEMPVEAAALGPTLERADRVRVGSDHDIRRSARAERQHTNWLIGTVDYLVGPHLTNEERDDLPLLEFAPATDHAQARPAREDHDQLLLTQMVVVRIRRLPWWDLPQAETKPFSADLAAEACAAALEARVVAVLIELGIAEVRHSRIVEKTRQAMPSKRFSKLENHLRFRSKGSVSRGAGGRPCPGRPPAVCQDPRPAPAPGRRQQPRLPRALDASSTSASQRSRRELHRARTGAGLDDGSPRSAHRCTAATATVGT